jgi:hypothetical protein
LTPAADALEQLAQFRTQFAVGLTPGPRDLPQGGPGQDGA